MIMVNGDIMIMFSLNKILTIIKFSQLIVYEIKNFHKFQSHSILLINQIYIQKKKFGQDFIY